MNVSKRIMFAVVACSLLLSTSSGDCGLKKLGQAGMQFLKLSGGARTLAMGNTGIAIYNNDANSLFINPGLITDLENNALSINYCDYWLDMSIGSIAYVKNMGNFGSIAVSAFYFGMGEFEETLEDPDFHLGNNLINMILLYIL